MSTFAETIRALRQGRDVPLRVVAAAIEIDSTLLSRFELGERFPTTEQLKRFADYFHVPLDEFASQVIADRIISAYGNSEVTNKAAALVQERFAEFGATQDEKPKR